MNRIACFIVTAIVLIACNNNDQKKNTDELITVNNSPGQIKYTVVNRFPHDTTSFTEGLLVHNGQLFESTGHTEYYASSRSLFGIVDKATGKIAVKAEIDKKKYFGEGIAIVAGKVYQLTETSRIGFIYDTGTFKRTGDFHYKGDGWGLTSNGHQLIMSDGSSNIVYRDPETFQPVKTLNVSDNNGPLAFINELELIGGYLYANQFETNYILRIDTTSGKVLGRIDLSALKAEATAAYPDTEETNGIAFDPVNNKIYVTGKHWPYLYEIKLTN